MKFLPPPGPERRRQVTRLVVLLGLLVAILWLWAPAGTPDPSSNQPMVGPGAVGSGNLPLPDAIRLDALKSVSELEDAGRNPFVFGERGPSVAAPGTAFLRTPQPALPPSAPPAPPVPQGPPPIALRLTGLTIPIAGGPTLVTLKDTGSNALYQVYEGDIVDGRYRLMKVGTQSVVVAYLDGSGIRTLPLGG